MRHFRRRLPLAVLSLTFVAAGCSGSSGAAADAAQPGAALPEGHPAVSGGEAPAAPVGVVLETMDAGGYTYAKLDMAGQELWFAGPPAALQVGDRVSASLDMPMENFTSSALGRTFDVLYFTGVFTKAGAADAVRRGVVKQTMDSGGFTYLEVESDGATFWLAGPETLVKVGDAVTWSGGMVMNGFTSSTLNRTFDEIHFVEAVTVGGAS